MKAILGWLEERTGAGKLTREVLCANIPGGARWRYVWGGTLVFAIGVQFKNRTAMETGFFRRGLDVA